LHRIARTILQGLFLAAAVSAAAEPVEPKPTYGVGLELGVDVECGIGKTRDRTFVQPWNLTTSAQLACNVQLFDDYGLAVRCGYAFFNDEPVAISWIPEESFTSELTVHELCVGICQLLRPVPLLWLEQGLALLFPFNADYTLYRSHLSNEGWTDYEFYSRQRVHRSFYYFYPLVGLSYGVGFDVSRMLPRNTPVSVFFRYDFGLVPMYLGTDMFAATGREQVRLSWGLRGMPVELGKPAPNRALCPGARQHALEYAIAVGAGLGNLQSAREDPRFHPEEMAWGAFRSAYVYRSRFRFALELGDQLRQYTESEFTREPGHWQPDDFRGDYFRHYLNYLGAAFWLEALPIRCLVSGIGIGLSWMLPAGDYGWRYVAPDASGPETKQRVHHPNRDYERRFDPALFVKFGTPLYRYTGVPLELDVVFQRGWRTVDVLAGFYRQHRPVYTAASLAVVYLLSVSR
jgi:hypothetical protein